jgi:hypothetical protein
MEGGKGEKSSVDPCLFVVALLIHALLLSHACYFIDQRSIAFSKLSLLLLPPPSPHILVVVVVAVVVVVVSRVRCVHGVVFEVGKRR